MILLDMKQGSPEWIDARLGIPTASQFDKIISPKTGKLKDAGARTYMHKLIAERLIGASLDEGVSAFMERGTEMEAEAVTLYELQRGVDTQEVGHVLTDDRRVGCSPDRLVGDDGGLEIKCPAAHTHVAYMLEAPDLFRCQIQGGLWVTERSWWDFLSFNPEMPPVLKRFERDEEFIEKLAAAVGAFCDKLDAAMEKIGAGACP